MKKLSAMLIVSVLVFGASMANANLWSEDFQGYNNNDDWVALDADWAKEVRYGLNSGGRTGEEEASWIDDNAGAKTANQSFTGWYRNGNHISDQVDLTGVAAVTGNTLETIQYKVDVTSQSGMTYANRTAVHFDLLSPQYGGYEFLRVENDWQGIKLNGSLVYTLGLNDPIPLGRYIVTIDLSANQEATLQIDSAFGGESFLELDGAVTTSAAAKFRTYGWTTDVGPGDIQAARAKLIYYDAGDNVRSAQIGWDNMALTPEPTTILLLAAGSGMLLRRRRR